jgi:hypothetical protein
MIFSALEVPIKGDQIFLNTKNNGALPSDLAYFERLSVIIAIQLQFNLQVKNN